MIYKLCRYNYNSIYDGHWGPLTNEGSQCFTVYGASDSMPTEPVVAYYTPLQNPDGSTCTGYISVNTPDICTDDSQCTQNEHYKPAPPPEDLGEFYCFPDLVCRIHSKTMYDCDSKTKVGQQLFSNECVLKDNCTESSTWEEANGYCIVTRINCISGPAHPSTDSEPLCGNVSGGIINCLSDYQTPQKMPSVCVCTDRAKICKDDITLEYDCATKALDYKLLSGSECVYADECTETKRYIYNQDINKVLLYLTKCSTYKCIEECESIDHTTFTPEPFLDESIAEMVCQDVAVCCKGNDCTLTTEANCSDGIWKRDEKICDPNPCITHNAKCLDYYKVDYDCNTGTLIKSAYLYSTCVKESDCQDKETIEQNGNICTIYKQVCSETNCLSSSIEFACSQTAHKNITFDSGIPDSCTCPAKGACCVDAICHPNVTESDCEINLGGHWMGDGVSCDPNPCPYA